VTGFRASRFNIFVPLHHGRRLAYNSLSGAFALWEADDCRVFEEIAGGVRPPGQEFEKAGFVVPRDLDEVALLEQQYIAHRFDGRSLVLTIAPTMACNFGCDYCFQGQDKPVDTMTPEVQDAILTLAQRAAPDLRRIHVAWYGGEPLMRRKVVESLSDRLIAFCDGRGLTYDASMVSNGFLLGADVIRSLERRRVKTIQVTLDGVAEYHDDRRYLLNGRPTFGRILGNLKDCVEASPVRLSIRVNIDSRNAADLRSLMDHLAEAGLANRKNHRG
jgi:uncharacterized protein